MQRTIGLPVCTTTGSPKALYSGDQREIKGSRGSWCPGAESNHRHRDFQSSDMLSQMVTGGIG